MFIRRKPNKSGTFSIQVVDKVRSRYTLVKSFGASKSEDELSALEGRRFYINLWRTVGA